MQLCNKKDNLLQQPGKENTEEAIRLLLLGQEKGTSEKLVVATSSGETGLKVARRLKEKELR
jgi:hypothetical protein